jgi:cytochrome c oxidase subunit 1
MIGVVTSFGIYAATYYWFPKMFGRMMNETLGKLHFWLTTIGVFAAFTSMHFLGLAGYLRRMYDPTSYEYTRQLQWLNVLITAALFVAAAAQVLFVINVAWSLRKKEVASANPWESATLEWTTASPAPHLNWAEVPAVYRGPYEYRVDDEPLGYRGQTAPQHAGAAT